MSCDWADHDARLRSYALFADEVMPHYQDSIRPLRESYAWGRDRKEHIVPEFNQAFLDSTKKYFGDEHARTQRMKEMLGLDSQTEQTPQPPAGQA